MSTPAGFRFALWAKLAALLRQGADFFERKSHRNRSPDFAEPRLHDGRATPMPAGSLNGAPQHWLAMVKKRAPGFLHRLEFGAGQATLLAGTTRQHEHEERHASFNHRAEPSVAEPIMSATTPTIRSERRPVEKNERGEPRETPGSDDADDKPRIKQDDAATFRNTTDQSRKTAGLETAQRTGETSRAQYQTALRFESKKPTSSFKLMQQTQSERPDVFNIQPVRVVKEEIAVNNRFSDRVQMTEPYIKELALPTEDRLPNNTFKVSVIDGEQRPSKTMPANPESEMHEAVHNDQATYASAQGFPTATGTRPAPCQDPASDCRNVSADGFWPELSGLKKKPVHPGLWPELPEDAWSELWHNLAEPVGMDYQTEDSDRRGDSWNG